MLLSRVSTGDGLVDLSGGSIFGGGGLTAQYYTNARLAGRPLVTRVRVLCAACFTNGTFVMCFIYVLGVEMVLIF